MLDPLDPKQLPFHLRDEQEQVTGQETGTEQSSGFGSRAVSHVGQEGESDHGEMGVRCKSNDEKSSRLEANRDVQAK